MPASRDGDATNVCRCQKGQALVAGEHPRAGAVDLHTTIIEHEPVVATGPKVPAA